MHARHDFLEIATTLPMQDRNHRARGFYASGLGCIGPITLVFRVFRRTTAAIALRTSVSLGTTWRSIRTPSELSGMSGTGTSRAQHSATRLRLETNNMLPQTAGNAHARQPGLDARDLAAHRHKAEYTCSMHPEVREENPGRCPKCGMPLALRTGP